MDNLDDKVQHAIKTAVEAHELSVIQQTMAAFEAMFIAEELLRRLTAFDMVVFLQWLY